MRSRRIVRWRLVRGIGPSHPRLARTKRFCRQVSWLAGRASCRPSQLEPVEVRHNLVVNNCGCRLRCIMPVFGARSSARAPESDASKRAHEPLIEDWRMSPWLTVVGIGEEGWSGLGRPARRALLGASTIFGGERHLAMLPGRIGGARVAWPTPFSIAPVLAGRGTEICVLASGDPMAFGVGATFARALAGTEFRVIPTVSSMALAAARLQWPLQEVTIISLVGRPIASLNAHLHPGARLIVLSSDGSGPFAVASLLNERGFGASRMSVFEHLGGVGETRIDGDAATWPTAKTAALNLVGIEC